MPELPKIPDPPLYWIVGGDLSKVYSFDVGDYVPLADPTYQAYVAEGKITRNILNELELGEVLAQRKAPQPVPQGVLDGYLGRDISRVDRALALTLFDLVNRVLALEGKQPVTKQQFFDYMKQKLQAG